MKTEHGYWERGLFSQDWQDAGFIASCCSTSARFGNRKTNCPLTSKAVLSQPSPRCATLDSDTSGNCSLMIDAAWTAFSCISDGIR